MKESMRQVMSQPETNQKKIAKEGRARGQKKS